MSLNKIKNFDWILFLLMIFLMLLGNFLIFSASTVKKADNFVHKDFYLKQILWIALSLMFFLVILFTPYPIIDTLILPLYFLSLILLFITLFMPVVNGSHRWIPLKIFNLQASDFAKLMTIMLAAKLISKPHLLYLKIVFFTILVFLPPVLLIMKEPDLGTALTFVFIALVMLSYSQLPLIYVFLMLTPFLAMLSSFKLPILIVYFVILLLILIKNRIKPIFIFIVAFLNIIISATSPFIWNHLKTYQQNRILTFLNPMRDPFGSGYQILQAKIAIGSGGFWGKGFLQGTQKNLNFLPEHHTDFIFSVLGEEFGFFGCLFLLVLYFLFLNRILVALKLIKRDEKRLITVGIFAYLLFQIFINIGMNLGIVPATGIPLPFVSYGGTNLIINVIAVSLIVKFLKEKSAFE